MFPPTYFAPFYFAGHFFAPAGSNLPAPPPLPPPYLTQIRVQKMPHGNSYASRVVVQAGRTYVLTSQIESVYAVCVTDITDPANPFVAARIGWGDLDGTGVSKEDGFVYGLETNSAGTRAYVAHRGVITALDISALPAVTNVGGGTTPLVYDTTTNAGATFLSRDGGNLLASIAGHGTYALDISNPAAIGFVRFTGPYANDDGRYQSISNVVTIGAAHAVCVGTANHYSLMDVATVASGFLLLAQITPVTAYAPNDVTSAPERQAPTALLTSTRLYTVEGNASPPAGMQGLNRCTVYVRSLDASEGGSLAIPLLLGNSPFLEPMVIDLREITRGGRRHLVCTCCHAWATQTVQGVAGAFSGRVLVILDVENPALITVVSTFGPPFAGSKIDRTNPPYESYSTTMVGTVAVTASYGYGLSLTETADPAAPVYLSRALLSGESRWIAQRDSLMALGDAISTARFYDVGTDPENPAFLGNYYSQSQVFAYGITLPPTAPGYCFLAGITSTVLEIVDTSTFTLAAQFTLPFSIYGMDYDQGGAARMVVWGFIGSNPAWSLLDITNPLTPVILMTRLSDANGDVRCRRCILTGDRLIFTTWGNLTSTTATGGGFRVYDVSVNPPAIIASVVNTVSVNAPVRVADAIMLTSGARRFLLTVPYWDSSPTAIIVANGGIWVYEITDWAAPVSMTRDGNGVPVNLPMVTHTTLLGANQACIFGGFAVLPGYLVAGEYYQGPEALDVGNAAAVSPVGHGNYMPGAHFTFCAAGRGLDIYALTISDLHVYNSAVVPVPAPPAPGPSLLNWTVTAVAPDVDEALTGGWWEVRDRLDTTRFSIVTGDELRNLLGGSYGAAPAWPGSPPLDSCLVRFHDGKSPDRPETEIVNLSDLLQKVQVG